MDNRTKKELAIVLVSGGMDSCVTAAIAAEKRDLALLHFNYGQKTERKEEELFNKLADHFGAERRLAVDMPFFKKIGGSSMTDDAIPVTPSGNNPGEIPMSYVPFRNANFLAAAVSWAEVIGAKEIYIGAVEEDSSGYPDCRNSFYDAYRGIITEGTRPETEIDIITPVIHLRKSEIIKLGNKLGAPLHLTWSCYRDEDTACGECDSCILRRNAFEEAGESDPVPYK